MTIPSISDISERYAPDDERPLGSFLVLMSAYGAAVATGAAVLRWRGVRLPDRLDLADLGMAAVATHKLSRLLAKDAVTSPLRAPFTRFAGSQGDAELKEEVLGRGPRKALGELVTCPFCLSQWIATSLVFGLLANPRLTRVATSLFTVVAASDALQHVYAHLQEAD